MTSPHHDEPNLDATIRVDSLPPDGRDLNFVANDEQRAALADFLDVSAVERLEVELNASKFRGGIRVLGRLRASVVQPCVVTFVPVTQEIDEPVDRVFLPGREVLRTETAGAEIFVDLEGEDVPDHFEGPEADLSGLIVETLSLAIDPYPRAPGASLDELGLDTDKDESPFAKLKVLKPKNE